MPATVIGDREGAALSKVMTRYTAPFNLAGVPCLVVPAGKSGGLPVGLQLVAAPGRESLLYAADKAEHVESVVAPALARGEVVVTDRYVDSTLAYQGAGRSLVSAELAWVARWATGDLRPHLTVLLDLEPGTAFTRFRGRDRIDVSRTVRSMLRDDGEPATLARFRPRIKPRRLVLLLDVSGSMSPYADVLLRFAHAAVRVGPTTTEVFTISTRLASPAHCGSRFAAVIGAADGLP